MPIKRVDYRYFQAISSTCLIFPFTLQESFEFGSFKNLYTNLDIFGIKANLERIVIKQKKQKGIRDYF